MGARRLTARGETPAAFGRRCIPAPPHRAEKRAVGAPAADCVAPPSNIPDIAPHRAQDARWGPRSAVVAPLRRGPHGADCAPWGGSAGRLAALGATLDFHHGLFTLCAIAGLATVSAVSPAFPQSSLAGDTIHISRATGPVTIDGDLSDEGWNGPTRVEKW